MPSQRVMTLPIMCYGCNQLRPPDDTGQAGTHSRWVYNTGENPRHIEYEVFLCQTCIDNATLHCASCYEAFIDAGVPNSHVYAQVLGMSDGIWRMMDTDELVCEDCCYTCECGESYASEDNMYRCCSQDYDRNRGYINNYSYRPYNMRFYRMVSPTLHMATGNAEPGILYMGMEIEVEKVRDLLPEFYNMTNEEVDNPSRIYVKSDGSLSGNGAEFVTMPMTLDCIKLLFPWHAFDYLQQNGARAWAYGNCGMHIHVSRSAFTPSHMYRFLRWQLENSQTCIKFAGRDSNWSRWDNEAMEQMKDSTAKFSKEPTYLERYSALNVQPRETVELRYFRSNILMRGILRNVEWVDALYNYTRTIPFMQIRHRDGFHIDGFREYLNDNATKYENALNHLNMVLSAGAGNDDLLSPEDIERIY